MGKQTKQEKQHQKLAAREQSEQFPQQKESDPFNQEFYREMANDAARERKAEEWCERLLTDVPDE